MFLHRFAKEVQEMTHFSVVKEQVYSLIVHTFHMLVLHLPPDVTKTHNNLSGHISLSPFFFFSWVIKASVICICNQIPAAQEQRAAGPTLEGPGADVEAGVCRALDSRGWRGKHRSLIRSALQRRKSGSALQSCLRPYWNSQQNNNWTLSVLEKQQRYGSIFPPRKHEQLTVYSSL